MDRDQDYAIVTDAEIGEGSQIYDQVNLYGCTIGRDTKVDAFVYIEEDVVIGNNCTVRPFTFIPGGVTIGNRVFIGPGVIFTNDMYPSVDGEWQREETVVEDDVSIGARAVILPGVAIGSGATIGAGAVVTEDIPPRSVVAGNPATELESGRTPMERE